MEAPRGSARTATPSLARLKLGLENNTSNSLTSSHHLACARGINDKGISTLRYHTMPYDDTASSDSEKAARDAALAQRRAALAERYRNTIETYHSPHSTERNPPAWRRIALLLILAYLLYHAFKGRARMGEARASWGLDGPLSRWFGGELDDDEVGMMDMEGWNT